MPLSFTRKIVGRDELLRRTDEHRRDGRRIVHCHGCFDIVHPGHIRYLEFARRQGDVLLVSLTGDSEIAKGPQRPYIPQELRAENLAALEFVDLVHVDPHPTAEDLLEAVRPDVYVKGKEYETSSDPAFLRERQVVEKHGGRVIFSSGEAVFSSSSIIAGLPGDADLERSRLNLLCQRHRVTSDRLRELVHRFENLSVLVVGDTIVDRYVFCDALDVASEAPVMSVAALDERTYVGGAAIVARHASALGASATLVTAGGEDRLTREATAVLQDDRVESVVIPNRKSLVEKTRYLADDHKLLKVEKGERAPLDSITERQAAATILRRSQDVQAVIFCDFGYGCLTPSLLNRVLPMLRERVPVLAADVSGNQGNLLQFSGVDLLCPTERELRGTLHDLESGLSSVAWALLAKTQARRLFVTLDKRGMVAFSRRSMDPATPEWSARLVSDHLPSLADRVVDRLGCGDALLAVATLALAAGAKTLEAAYLGSAAAALEIARPGNMPIKSRDLVDWFGRRPELTVPTCPVHHLAEAV